MAFRNASTKDVFRIVNGRGYTFLVTEEDGFFVASSESVPPGVKSSNCGTQGRNLVELLHMIEDWCDCVENKK